MSTCDPSSAFNGLYMGARIASIFVLLAVSAFGSFFPLLATKWTFLKLPTNALFLTKHFGTGVILATGFIHLLGEAETNLGSPCLTGIWEEYSWASGISLMGTFTMFTIELLALRLMIKKMRKQCEFTEEVLEIKPGLKESEIEVKTEEQPDAENVYKKVLSLCLLEFGIVFHSVFVGLSLAIAGEEFKTLFVAITFHQFFEGLGLGSRFATAIWPENMKKVPWMFSLAYTLITPIGIAAGLGVRHLYLENATTTLIVVGVVDSFCSGILIYNCLVELMALDYLFDREMQDSSGRKVFSAYVMLVLGTGLMALIGKWA